MKRAYKLFEEVLSVSHASTWDEARTEWSLQQLYRDDSAERSCTCGKTLILNVCVVHNALTDNLLVVGNCCVHKFLLLPSKRIFAAFMRLMKAMSEELDRGLLNQEAIAFLTQQQ